jgi:hypothetical protein
VPEDAADGRCSPLFRAPEPEENQSFGPDVLARVGARGGRGRFSKGHSGNPRGRPPGIRNPRRRVPAGADPVARLALLLPLPAAEDPAERLGIDLAAVRTPADVWRTLQTLWAALRRGEIGAEAAGDIAKRAGARLPPPPSLAELERRLARIQEQLASAGLTIAAPADESAGELRLSRKAAQS